MTNDEDVKVQGEGGWLFNLSDPERQRYARKVGVSNVLF